MSVSWVEETGVGSSGGNPDPLQVTDETDKEVNNPSNNLFNRWGMTIIR